MKIIKRINRYFSVPIHLAILNTALVTIIIIGNIHIQAFCVPSLWAAIVLTICFGCTIIYPLLFKYNNLVPILSFINGISFCIFIYCVIFLGWMNLLWPLLILICGIGLLILAPQFFLVQLFWRNVIKPVSRKSRQFFLYAIILCAGITFFIGMEYRKAINYMEIFEDSGYEKFHKNFFTEKILGMHFIYHTEYCLYDGWRPPQHEPILILGMWLNNKRDPLKVDLSKRLELYRKFFPDRKVKFDCSCAIEESESYHNDNLWKEK